MYLVLKFHGDGEWLGIECLKGLFRKMIVKKNRLRNTHLGSVSASETVHFLFLGCLLISEGQDKWKWLWEFCFFFKLFLLQPSKPYQLLSRWKTHSPLNSLWAQKSCSILWCNPQIIFHVKPFHSTGVNYYIVSEFQLTFSSVPH